jgi:hypothetical protein
MRFRASPSSLTSRLSPRGTLLVRSPAANRWAPSCKRRMGPLTWRVKITKVTSPASRASATPPIAMRCCSSLSTASMRATLMLVRTTTSGLP